MKSAFARWIPHDLTENQKAQRVDRANELVNSTLFYNVFTAVWL